MNMATLGHLIKVLKCRRLIDIDEKLIQMNLNCEIFLWQGKQAEHDGLTGKTAKTSKKWRLDRFLWSGPSGAT
jgi:hypothetical protein